MSKRRARTDTQTSDDQPGLSDPLRFDLRDLDLFRATDVPTRLAALQNHFFPKLERLVQEALSLIHEIHQAPVSSEYTLMRHPKFRRDAVAPVDTDQVMLGLAPRRTNTEQAMRKADGSLYRMGPGQLLFRLHAAGGLQTLWEPYRRSDGSLRSRWRKLVRQNWTQIQYLITRMNIVPVCEDPRVEGHATLEHESALWAGPIYPLPIVTSYARRRLVLEFAVLFPLFHAGNLLALGSEPPLAEDIDRTLAWCANAESWLSPTTTQQDEDLIDESNGYTGYVTIRPRKWWAVLVRDNWTCVACRRNSSRDKVMLEVDHILPRSKGGTDDESNLQTLCKKCNSGKSNLDQTDLRS